jgi:hypothetical protein
MNVLAGAHDAAVQMIDTFGLGHVVPQFRLDHAGTNRVHPDGRSTARARVSASIAPRMLAAIVQPLRGRSPATPFVKVIDPPERM